MYASCDLTWHASLPDRETESESYNMKGQELDPK